MGLASDILAARGPIVISGAPEGLDARVLAELAVASPAGVLHVARDGQRMATLEHTLRFFAPDLEVVSLPAWDCVPYDRVSPDPDVAARRMRAMARMAAEPRPRLVLTTVNAALQRLPARDFVRDAHLRIAVGQRIDPEELFAFLGRNGFNRTGTVVESGEYAVRGGIVDLFPPGAEAPLRLDFFGDTLESIRVFDALSQRTIGKADRFDLTPVSEVPLTEESVARFRSAYRELFGAVTDGDPLYEAVSARRRQIGIEHWLPLFHPRLETVFDYCPDAFVTRDHLAEDAVQARLVQVQDHYQARVAALSDPAASGYGQGAPYKPVPPELLYPSAEEWQRLDAERGGGRFTAFRPAEDARHVDAGGRPGRDFAEARAKPDVNVFDALGEHLRALARAGRRVLIAGFSTGSVERLGMVLQDHGIEGFAAAADWPAVERLPRNAGGLVVLPIEHGFETDDLAVVGEQDILGDRLVGGRRRSRRAENFLTEAAELTPGDLVVHVEHGIGRYEGLKTLEVSGAPHDCLAVAYADDARLYVPVENIDVLSRFGSEDSGVPLDRLGGAAWQARKAKLKKRIRDMAEELIRIAAQRTLKRADVVTPPEGAYDEFCARFPFEETEDQLRAIEDVFEDLAAGKPMDRLVCGDVGFGKTEVALRAAFAATLSGLQVAVVAPTTLLCRQHFRTFSQRFAGLPVEVRQLSRLVTGKHASEARAGLKEGTVDIVVGTHALLGKQVGFRRLGLLIVDEEQHFGVKHKERLKQLKADVHVLTLSATPIPRTLQLAFSGVKDLSLIATPPVDRLAVRNFVLPFDPVVIREALLREHYRGGQSFYVCPRIADLPDAADFLRLTVPELKVAQAHGRMAAAELEDVMNAFYDGAYDVLLATNIIESGLDIPAANTLVVHRSDMFGLAQLYQLRGRIGRSKQRAYAYFTLPANRPPTANAEKRLKVIHALDSLGAGFSLASHDLDIRGAGNLLGEEQSGHIREVGLELYQQMLEEAVAAAREGDLDGIIEERWSPQIGIGTAVLIPEDYVADLGVRLGLYRRLADLADRADIDGFAAEMIDRFGPLPVEVNHLLEVMTIKQWCRAANIERIDAGAKGATLSFRENRFADPAGLVGFIAEQRGTAKLRPDHKLVYMRNWDAAEDRLKGVAELTRRLAGLAQSAAENSAA